MADNVKMSEMITYMQGLLARQFASRVTKVYFGDIGRYPPSVFGSSRQTQKAVIAISPMFNRLVEGSRVASSETREYGVRIIVLMNITPFFEAQPEEAYAERELSNLTQDIAEFLTLQDNVTLDGRVNFSVVGDIDFAWMQRQQAQYLRGGAVEYTARVRVTRAK